VCFLVIALVALIPSALHAAWIDLGGEEPLTVRLLESTATSSTYEVTIGGFEADRVQIDGRSWFEIHLPGEPTELQAGLPQLPIIRRALTIPDDRAIQVRVLDSESVDLPNMPIAPSKGNLLRSVDPKTVAYTFDPFYETDGTWPEEVVTHDDAHILRDLRGVVVQANSFQCLPARETLRVHTRLVIEVSDAGPAIINPLYRQRPFDRVDPQFEAIYREHFLNYPATRYTPVAENGGLLIIAYDSFHGAMAPLVEWKRQKGLDTRSVMLSEVGATFSQIKSYITTAYNDWAPAYVLLVGDIAQIPIGSDSDPEYSTLAGSDSYPELFVGRFSAETPAHVDTQVLRTITYERDQVAGATWPQYGMGVASNEGPGDDGEYDDEHEDVIRQKLLNYGYLEVDRFYAPNATAAMVTSALNDGRGITNYTGHGSSTSWVTTGFSNSHVNALTNDNMLPFICSVACNNGTFTGTCFAEAWLRATNGGTPTGAIATYMSFISQTWNPPMCAQDEFVDLLVRDEMRTIGGLWFNGSCQMMDEYGTTGANEFLNWTIFGDPTVAVRTKAATTLTVSHTGALFIGMTEYAVSTGEPGALCALYADGVIYGTATADPLGDAVITLANPPTEPMTLTLTVTAYNRVTVQEGVTVLPPSGPYLVFHDCSIGDVSSGDGDGVLDHGETVDLDVVLENVGIATAVRVTAALTSVDPYVQITVGTAAFEDIAPGGTASSLTPYVVEVAGDVPDGYVIPFALHITGSGGPWEASFNLPVQAPSLTAVDCPVSDTAGGNGSGTADSGETVQLQVLLQNSGASDASELTGTLSCSDENVVVLDPAGTCPLVPVQGQGLMGTFDVQILGTCPEPSMIAFDLAIETLLGHECDLSFELAVGGWFDDLETDRGWTVGAPGDDASTGVWLRADPVGTTYNGAVVQTEDDHTPAPGTMCFVTGNANPGESAGTNDVDDGTTTLLSPVFDLSEATSATVSYWRWYTNDAGNYPGEDWWNVEVTSDGSTWVSLEHTQASLADWQLMTFSLGSHVTLTDQVQIRFVASDLMNGSLVEAAVDDFLLDATYGDITAVRETLAPPQNLALTRCYPNPFGAATTIHYTVPRPGKIDLAIYDIAGRCVATLVSGVMPAGRHEATWHGRDDRGSHVVSGMYFSRLTDGTTVKTKKMLHLK
jgi:hypothetical protein